MTEDSISFSFDICSKPNTLICLTGLEPIRNALHRSIWETFGKNQSRLPILLQLVPSNHQFPVPKPKKANYERHIPKGILKKNWMRKHLLEIPSVVAVLYELSFDDPNWEQQKNQCVIQVQAMKSQLGSLGTRLALILIQKQAPLPDDSRSAERSAALCSACDLPIKQLFILPQGDHMNGFIMRLESALYELAKMYYTQEIKMVKNHKDQLNKTTHRYLLVRHNFKMGFLSELKQDDRNARGFYEVAYNHLKEVRMTDTNTMEVKLIAGYISYKLCAVMFRLGEPRDALTQLRTHVRLYKPRTGSKDLLFEHYNWLAVQYAAFADLFDDAIRQGLAAMQTEHPGFYYKQAALYATDRKLVAREICLNVENPPDLAFAPVEFCGQRPWRPGKLSVEPLDPVAEKEGIQVLQAAEARVDHSAIIIGYLGNAISQFKTYRCPRMRLQLLAQMAEEYHSAGVYGQTLTLLSHMLRDYRTEKWWHLLTFLLKLGLSAAYLAANIQDYVSFLFESLAESNPLAEDQKLRIFNNLCAVLKGEPPDPEPGVPPELVHKAHSSWTSALATQPKISSDMKDIDTCFRVRAKFSKETFQMDEPIGISLQISSSCPGDLQLQKLSLIITSDDINTEIIAVSSPMTLEAGKSTNVNFKASCSIPPGREIRFGAISLVFGGTGQKTIVLSVLPHVPERDVVTEFQQLRFIMKGNKSESSSGNMTSMIVAPKTDVSLNITHNSPALLGEQYPVHIAIVNSEPTILLNAVLSVKLLSPGDESTPDQSTRLSDAQQTSIDPRNIKVSLDKVLPGATVNTTIYLKGYSAGDRTLSFVLTYKQSADSAPASNITFSVESQTVVPVMKPFEVSSECMTTKFESAPCCFAQETFLLCTSVVITAPCPLTIHHSTVELGLLTTVDGKELTSQLAGVTLGPGESGRDVFPLRIMEARDQPLAVGTYVLQWSREGSEHVTSSSITLPAVRCQSSVLSVGITLPAHGRVRTPMAVEYRLHNRTSGLLQLDLHVDASDAFMFSGPRQIMLRLLPESVRKLQYNLYPLFSGLVALPKLVLTAQDLTDDLSSILERNLPTHVYVMPQDKTPGSAGL